MFLKSGAKRFTRAAKPTKTATEISTFLIV
jgi:hypothetical protein